MDFIKKMFEFGTVGLIGMCVDFFITWLFKEKFSINRYVANSIGFTCAVISNFFLNLEWTFKAAGQNTNVYFFKFLLIALVGLALSNLLVYLFNGRLRINFYISKLLAVIIVFIWNFMANNYFNFHH